MEPKKSCSNCGTPIFNKGMTDAEREAAEQYYEMTSRPNPIARRTPLAMYYRPAGYVPAGYYYAPAGQASALPSLIVPTVGLLLFAGFEYFFRQR